MDGVQRSIYETRFELAFLKKKGEEYQAFFAEIMCMRYPGDYIPTRPWGNLGDRKNDGYLKSKRILYQVYAPHEGPEDRMSGARLRKTLAKIDSDFLGALPYWQEYFDTWTFVHNARTGLAAPIIKKLLDLERANAPLRVANFGYAELRMEVFKLCDPDVAALLGSAPGMADMVRIRFDDLKPVLDAIAGEAPVLERHIRPVPAQKLEANSLSPNTAALLRAGMTKSARVKSFFGSHPDPQYGDRIAAAFKRKYHSLREEPDRAPDGIFRELWLFAGGNQGGTTSHEAAVLAVLAYLFEECEIFERLPERGAK